MKWSAHTERQRRFYASRVHDHLQARDDDFYASKLAERLASELGIAPRSRVLELGAGFGRFTFHLLGHCASVTALDLSEVALARLEHAREERGIAPDRCRTRIADLEALDDLGERFDFVVGFFLLHHLSDPARAIRNGARQLAPGGGIGFLEPNRRNPLFLAQIACCRDMTWAEEKGMFRLSRARVESGYREAGLTGIRTATCGFFPPQLLNRFPAAGRFEGRLERARALRAFLPFLLLCAQSGTQSAPDGGELGP